MMRVVFLGTPTFAVPALRALLDNSYEVCCVVTQPDRPSGRGQKLRPSPIKALAQQQEIPVFQPHKIRDQANRPILEILRPDFVVVAAYGQILPGWLLQSARVAPVNIHASLLPRYRGAAPVAWAILNGETVTGVTTIIMQEELDAGPMLLKKEVPIPLTKTAGELEADLADVGANLLIQTLDGLRKNTLHPILQDEKQVSWAPRMTKEMACISWDKSAMHIHNQVRAMNPWPVAYSTFRDEPLRVWRCLPRGQASGSDKRPGSFIGLSQEGICVQCGEDSVLDLLEVQMPARGKVSGRAFANGAHLRADELMFR